MENYFKGMFESCIDPHWLDSIAVSVFVLFNLTLTNTQSETRTKRTLIARRAGLSITDHHRQNISEAISVTLTLFSGITINIHIILSLNCAIGFYSMKNVYED